MAKWRPKLVVRRARGGGIASPTTTIGYVFLGLIGVAIIAPIVLLAREVPWVLLMLIVLWWPLRDAFAWFVASHEEREAFRLEIAQLQARRR